MPLNDLGGRLGIKHRGPKPRGFQLERRQVFRLVKAYPLRSELARFPYLHVEQLPQGIAAARQP